MAKDTRFIIRDKRDGKLYDTLSKTMIFKVFGADVIGKSYGRFARMHLETDFPYENESLLIEVSQTLVNPRSTSDE